MKNNKKKIEVPVQALDHKKNLFIITTLIAIGISIIYSYKLKWIGDDIFIGLRYVQNFVAGNGLVYNIGERVEGFTDFLWLMLVSLFTKYHFDPVHTVQTLGILSSVSTLSISALLVYKISKQYRLFFIPFITIALALNYDYNVWATGGLETAFFTTLITAAFYTFFFTDFQERKKLLVSGLFLSLAMMTRPDALLITFAVNGLFLIGQLLKRTAISKIISALFLLNLAFICLYIPYFLWRFNYYGFIFPNTYYDKLGNETLFGKGFYYLWLYFKPHFTTFLIAILPPFVLLPLLKQKPLEQLKIFIADRWNAAFLTAIIVVYTYLIIFIAKVGGDFMHARFVIPMTPLIYFIIFYSLLKLHFLGEKNLNILLIVLLLCSFVETNIRADVFKAPDKDGKIITTLNRDVADERWAYTSYLPIENEMKLGKALHNAFQGIDAKLLVRGGQACLAYYANFNYEQEYHGLTDTLIAHSKVEHRGRIGHEKHATYEYLQNKGIHFLFNRTSLSKDQYKFAQLDIPPYSVTVEIITYDTKIIEQLRQRFGENFKFTDFPSYLDYYIQTKLPTIQKDELKKDYDAFNSYYFKHNDDKVREEKFLIALK
jgi:arabinofuranosyltransferase